MYEIVYDVKAVYEKLNKTFAELGVPLKIEDFLARELRCVGVVTDKKYLHMLQEIMKKENVEITVNSIPVGLDWLPIIYYISVANGDALKALSLLEQTKYETKDISGYLESLAKDRARTERLLTWLGLIFIVAVAVAASFATLSFVLKTRWDVAVLLVLMTLLLVMIAIFSFKELRRKSGRPKYK